MRLILLIVLLAATALSGCKGGTSSVNSNGIGNGNGNANVGLNIKIPPPIKPLEAPDPNFTACNPYFPLVPGSVAKYVINYSSGVVGDLTVVIDAGDENGRKAFTQRSQLIDRSGGMKIVQMITRRFVCDGGRVQILSEKTESNLAGQTSSSDFEFRENSLMMTDPKSLLIKGSTWTHAFRQSFSSPEQPVSRSDQLKVISFEVGSPEHVTIAIGTFTAVPVTRKIDDNLTVDHYVAGLGLVKRQSNQDTMKMTIINPDALGQPRGYSNGLLFEGGSLLFVAGQIGWDRDSRIVSDDFADQFAQALGNVLAVVRQAGGQPENIGRLLIFVTDKSEYSSRLRDIGSAYHQLMGKHFPAMTLVEVSSLLEPLAKVEIEALAVIPAASPAGEQQ